MRLIDYTFGEIPGKISVDPFLRAPTGPTRVRCRMSAHLVNDTGASRLEDIMSTFTGIYGYFAFFGYNFHKSLPPPDRAPTRVRAAV